MASPDQREVEWQFDAVDLRPVERWLVTRPAEGQPSLVLRPTLSVKDTYLDTDDWRLHRAGFSLRLRENDSDTGAESTLKSLATATDGLRDRVEISEHVPKADPEMLLRAAGPVGERLRVLTAARPLEPLVEIRTTRRRFAVIANGTEIGEVALDHTTIPVDGDDQPVVLQRIEIESLARGREATLEPFVRELRDACGLQPASRSKYEAGLVARSLAPPAPVDLGPTDTDPSMTTGQVAFAALRPQLGTMLAHEPGVRLGEDPEEVHDMRVAIRRLRAGLTIFKDALPARSRWLRKELKWLGGSLGAVRDLDVQIGQLREWADNIGSESRTAIEPVVRILQRNRRAARKTLIRHLDSRRYERLVAVGTEVLRRGPLARSPGARVPVVQAAPELVSKPYRKVRRAGDDLDETAAASDLHALRIRCKRLRYALEFLSPVFGKPAKRLIKRLTSLQDILGLHQDAQVAMEHIHATIAAHGKRFGPETLFVLGRLAERNDRQAAELRRRFPSQYRKVRGKAWKALQEAMQASAPAEPPAEH